MDVTFENRCKIEGIVTSDVDAYSNGCTFEVTTMEEKGGKVLTNQVKVKAAGEKLKVAMQILKKGHNVRVEGPVSSDGFIIAQYFVNKTLSPTNNKHENH